jgi:hypothetical protein
MTPSSLGCLEFAQAALRTLLRHEADQIAYLPAATGETTGYAAHTGAADARF